ncbi:alpha-ketoglutarate-dependent dioxygenase AlkB [Cellulophaga sp. 20_2_10]|uniref:alpha-ketoglutarate-dependent dioxygenase AlkB family protein n=1 Tax=Cellulophaga sp. 20_2_10 TaxID=2942476 RepID=UPI00201A9B75|nr:alpha-ketoglutarate-dependent dioxygenase AlkB [Cellulophaga sp. 20_2_10]MCL5245542.1 alpha-ketoglutarate-dependent dioxygenase AlkB [Cellulophaga sp. 20_2_10]
MDLFNTNTYKNILPYDGEVYYYGGIMSINKAQEYYKALLSTIEWQHDKAIIFGKTITTKRKVAWYATKPFTYTYSKITKTALPWTKELVALKKLVEEKTGETFNSCLLNLYHSGEEGMAWHSDGEKDLKENGAIGSLSFGAERKFSFKHKENKQRLDINLDRGSLLIMTGTTQKNWLHRLPPTKKVSTPRINLTFRTIEN